MPEPEDGTFVFASTAPSEGILFQRDNSNGTEKDYRWFDLHDPDNVYRWADMLTDFDSLTIMEPGETYDRPQ